VGRNPTDRGKNGVKRSLLVEEGGGPLSVIVAGANRHDTKLLYATLDAIVVPRPTPTEEKPQHLCLDKGYDNPTGHEAAQAHGYTPTLRIYAGLGRKRTMSRERNATPRDVG
jgi:putative transposase